MAGDKKSMHNFDTDWKKTSRVRMAVHACRKIAWKTQSCLETIQSGNVLIAAHMFLSHILGLTGGIDALIAVAWKDAEPVLAAAAMQALTAMVGSADAKAMLLQHPGFLDALLTSLHTGVSCSTSDA